MARRKRRLSRADRWQNAVSEAQQAAQELTDALQALQEVHQEYTDWKENLPENLENSALGEKLTAVAELDIDSAVSEVVSIDMLLSDCEGADLPLGFGRD